MARALPEFVSFVMEQLSGLPELSCSRMFSGYGLRAGSVFFGIVHESALYFCVDNDSRPRYEALGSRCFSYQKRSGRIRSKRYFEVPAEIMEDAERFREFAVEAVAAAGRTRRPRKPRAHGR